MIRGWAFHEGSFGLIDVPMTRLGAGGDVQLSPSLGYDRDGRLSPDEIADAFTALVPKRDQAPLSGGA